MADRNRIQHIRAESGAFLVRLFSFYRIITKGANMTYKEWLSNWLANYVLPNYKPRTCERYTDIVSQHIIPKLGDYELSELTPYIVQQFVTELITHGNLKTGKGLAANTVNAIITVIQQSMETAHHMKFTDVYEMNNLKRPKLEEKPVVCFTVAEQRRIEQAVREDKRDKMLGVLICLYTGLRIGELMALEWDDIDFQKRELRVTKSCHDGKDKNGKICRVTGTPKTSHSNRVIPLPKQLIPILRDMKKRSNSSLVITDKGKIPSVRAYQRSFELLLCRIGVPHHGFHSLRHTFATRAIECGMDVKSLSEILGHKNSTVTLNRYVHSMMEYKTSMMDKLGKNL